MSLPGALCLCLIVSFANGEVEHGSCTGGSCEASDSTALLQNGLGVVDATEAAREEVAKAQGDNDNNDDDDDDSPPGDDDNTNVNCFSFKRGSTCRASGCQWSGAFVGEKKEDGSEVSGYICADDEEVDEEVHDKYINGTGSLIQILEDESEITSKLKNQRYCRRRRRGRGGGCPYCRRRRSPAPAPPAKIEANGCPTGFTVWTEGNKCSGNGKCCRASWTASCGQSCANTRCTSLGGTWIPLDYMTNPYTCEFPRPTTYCNQPNADAAGFDCLCATGTGYCGAVNTWVGTLAAAKTKCDGNAECKFLHDWKADGSNWRACRTITAPGDKNAALKSKSTSGTCFPLFDRVDADTSDTISRQEFIDAWAAGVIGEPSSRPAPTPAPTPAPALPTDPIFDRVDKNDDNGITKGEFRAAIAAGTIAQLK